MWFITQYRRLAGGEGGGEISNRSWDWIDLLNFLLPSPPVVVMNKG